MGSSIRDYFRRVAEGYEEGFCAKCLRPVLTVASLFYQGVSQTLRCLHEKKILPRKRLPFPVVSVGNLVWGGSGKTPFVEYLAHKVCARRRTPLVLTRGYGQDEVEQFKHHLPRAVIGVGKSRWKVANTESKKQPIHVGILDDGFQHWKIERDIEILMVNALNPFGNEKLIPRGILREPLSRVKQAAIIVISHSNLITLEELTALKERLRKLAPESRLVEAYLEPLFFYRAKRRARVPLERLHGKRVTTFSGLGTPRSFQMLLTRQQIKPVRNFEFTDHHVFSEKELKEIKTVSQSAFAEEIITTEKDFYRAQEMMRKIVNPLVLATRLRIASGEEVLTNRLFRLLGMIRS